MGRLSAQQDDTNGAQPVLVRATVRFKPEGNRPFWPDPVPSDAEPDEWGYVETEPRPVCTLHDCTEVEAGLVVHWCEALNDADSGFSGDRDNATKTNSLLDRFYDVRFPDPSDDGMAHALRSFLNIDDAEAYEVEFVTGEGETVSVLTRGEDDIRPMNRREIQHAQELAA